MWDNRKTQVQKVDVGSEGVLHPQVWGTRHITVPRETHILLIP